jgi:C4-type Zn-finger protein
MTTPAERISRVEGVLEQINERLGNIEAQNLRVLEQKADKSEMRLLFVTTITLLVAIIGLLGAVLART